MARSTGKLLLQKRESRYLSLAEAELATHIKADYLRALEEERFEALPGALYAEIYLREYARYLELEAEPLVQRYRQRTRWPRLWQRLGQAFRRWRRVYLLPTILVLLILGLVGGLAWIVLANRSAPVPAASPVPTAVVEKHLVVVYPGDRATLTGPQIVMVGQVPAGAQATVGGQLVPVRADGYFTHTIALTVGQTIVRVQGWDDQGWSEEITLALQRPAPTPRPTLSPAWRDVTSEFQIIANQIDVTHYPDMVAYFAILEASGEPRAGLSRENLSLYEDDRPVGDFVLRTVPPTEVLSVALAVDVSGSMAGEPLQQAQDALNAFVQSLGEQDRAALIAFADSVTLLHDFSPDRSALSSAVGALQTGGNTALNDAILYAVDLVAGQPAGRRAVIVMTDGRDTSSGVTLDQAIARAGLLNIPVYAVGLQSADFDGAPLGRVARQTGAVYLLAPEADALHDLYARLGRQFQGQYVVVYRSSGAAGSEHRLTLKAQINGVVRESSKSYQVP